MFMPTLPELLTAAWHHHQAGNLSQAEHGYQEVLRLDPQHADTLHLLGVLACQTGRPALGVDLLRRAVAVNPWNSDYNCNLGAACKELGQLDEASASLRRALQTRPEHATAWYNLGNVYLAQQKWADATACYQRTIQLSPSNGDAYFNLGKALWEQGQAGEAAVYFQQGLGYRPDYAEGHNNLGLMFYVQGRYAEAIASFQQALRLQPTYAEACSNLGRVLLSQGKTDQAVAHGREAVRLRPDLAEAHLHLGHALAGKRDWDAAVARYRQTIELDPDNAGARADLAALLRDQGKMDEADAEYQAAIQRRPSDWLRMAQATMLPPVYQSIDELRAWRRRLIGNLNGLQGPITLNLTNHLPTTLFRLAYQGLNDRELQAQMAALYARACPALNFVAPHCQSPPPTAPGRPLRVGFISYFFQTHSVARHYAGFIRHLSRPDFQVILFRFAAADDSLTHSLQQAADKVVTLGSQQPLDLLRDQIAAEQLDALVYTDIGMDPWTYFLAFARLAPVQCVLPGHPVTTGVPAIDYFLSSVDLEPADGDQHYTERLVRFANLPNYFTRPARTDPALSRHDFGLPEQGHLYLCVQTLFKIHPDFDDLAAGILRADPSGRLVLFHGAHPTWSQLLLQRLQRRLGPASDRVVFLPQQPYEYYLRLLTLADALLDTPHFSGGTTSFQALGLGVPIVTLPGPFMRGRVTSACYQRLGILDCVARDPDDYVRIALRLATERAWREELRSRSLAGSDALFENRGAVRELEAFLIDAVTRARQAQC
jgi:predicted O-linked N-acetylglucosamine transferase (SPINDLY family)